MTAEIDYAGVELIIKPVFEILDAPVQQARLENRDTSAGKFLKKNWMDRVGNLKDGKTVAFIPDPNTKTWATDNYTGTSAVEGVAVDES